MNGKISLKYIDELIKEKIEFAIPDYQRGYKWTAENIEELLNDIISLKDGEEYCLMPIIVRPATNNAIEIVDGQQRLTTLKLIIDYIQPDNIECNYKIPEECYSSIDQKNKRNALEKIESYSRKDDLKEKLLPENKPPRGKPRGISPKPRALLSENSIATVCNPFLSLGF